MKHSDLTRQIAALRQQANETNNFADYLFYAAIERSIAQLRAIGQIAARIYHDHSDEAAWEALYEALSDAGLLDTDEDSTNEAP